VRVLFDVSFARRGPSGTQVVVDALIPELRALGVEVIEADGRRGRHLNLAAEAQWQARLARAARRADVVHQPLPAWTPTRVPQVVTVHDLGFERLPDCFDARFGAYARRAHPFAARRAAAVLTPTRATADDIRALWGVESVVVPFGPGQAPRPDRGAPRHFLYVGDNEPRKNLPRLLAAYARYREQTTQPPLDLVLAGSAKATGPGVRVEPQPDLANLHRHAAALVLPSLLEGFGFPVVEAMHAGTPVLAADIPALREVAGDAARFADPYDVGALAEALTELATVGPLREELRRRGTARAAAFSWRTCALAYLDAYERAVTLRQL